jgi:hypothetical protein
MQDLIADDIRETPKRTISLWISAGKMDIAVGGNQIRRYVNKIGELFRYFAN